MFDYNACLVPDIKLRKKVYIWVAYSKDKPHLPVQIASTADELANKCGVSYSTVMSCWWKYRTGKIKSSPYHKVKVGYDLSWEKCGGEDDE